MKRYFIQILLFFYRKIWNNYIFILLVKKPINTWILCKFVNSNTYIRDGMFWHDETNHKTEWFAEISRPYEKKFLNYIIQNTNQKDSILDICCNQGRFIKELHNNNYRNLFGFDIMKPAIEILRNSREYQKGGIEVDCCLAQDYLSNSEANYFDYAITYTATIELMHPSFNIFKELYRVTKKGFIFALNENKHTYPRFYRYLIKRSGFKEIKIFKLNKSITLLHFEKII